jgi:pimeloyl-ACP methyl ester carboxylesterase
LLPALSSISTRAEMHGLARALAPDFRCIIPDWPGFGLDAVRLRAEALTPALLTGFLGVFAQQLGGQPSPVIAAGHSAAYVLTVAAETPERFSHIVLAAPTWRGPLPTAMGEHRRPLWRRLRRAVETPVVGPALFRLNMSAPVMRRMMRAHVYSDPAFMTAERIAAKSAVTRRRGARFATAAFVTGELDLVRRQEDFLRLFAGRGLPPVLVLIGTATPQKSRAAMEALAAQPGLRVERIPGSLAAHEEYPQVVGEAVRPFVLS